MILEAVATDVKDLSGRIIDDNRATGAWVNISGRGASLSMHGDPLRLQCLDNLPLGPAAPCHLNSKLVLVGIPDPHRHHVSMRSVDQGSNQRAQQEGLGQASALAPDER
jgi:hypothetical protein